MNSWGRGIREITDADDLRVVVRDEVWKQTRLGPEAVKSFDADLRLGRPVSVLDPFTAAPGLPELVWDPIAGCQNPMTAKRRAKAFTAGTISGAARADGGDGAARFYAGEAAKVLQGQGPESSK